MAVRVLLMVAVLMTLYGCGQPPSTAPEQGEKEDVEKAVAEKKPEATPKPKTTQAKAATVSCSDFYGPQDAQAYYDTRASAADKEALNSDGDEWACNEPGVAFAPEPKQMTTAQAPEETGIRRTPEFNEWNCRAESYVVEQKMSEAETTAFAEEMADRLGDVIEAGGPIHMEDILDDMGVPAYEDVCGRG